ncbi:MAG: hypothetical protein GX996_09555 [Firmicutes bacterium]|nr:hypothetical protein [Bacillota bacterium]
MQKHQLRYEPYERLIFAANP